MPLNYIHNVKKKLIIKILEIDIKKKLWIIGSVLLTIAANSEYCINNTKIKPVKSNKKKN